MFSKHSIAAAMAVSFTLSVVGPVTVLAAGPAAVNLSSAATFAILAKTGVSSTGSTSVLGDIGVSPAAATYITGFALTLPAASAFSTSAIVTGKVYSPSYADPTPANLMTAILDMQTAYTDATGRTNPTATELGAGNIGGLTIAPGLYKWGTSVTIPTDVTLSGGANDVWIFQIAQTLTVSSGVKVILSGGAQASNIFWIVAGQTTIGTTADVSGNILDQTAIVLNTGAKLTGRALAQTAVTLDSNAVTAPTATVTVQAPTPAPTPAAAPTPAPVPASAPSSPTSNNGGGTSSGVTMAPIVTTTVPPARISTNMTLESKTQNSMPAPSVFGQQVRLIAVNLGRGSNSTNVKTLQEFLISQNKGVAAEALAKVGATSYFGPLTRAALIEFQSNVGVSPAIGYFGPITRAYIAVHY